MPHKKQSRKKKQHHHPVIGPAPFLQKKHITLTDLVTVAGGSTAGEVLTLLNGNGYSDNSTLVTNRVPQETLWA